MPSGGCLCDKIRVSYTGEPANHALCHCQDCRKISGSTYSNNVIIPEANFKLESGTPKTFTKKADSGKTIISYFCSDCGSTPYRTTESFPGAVIVKAGVLDSKDWASENVPKAELFASQRVKWTGPIEGAAQVPTM